MTSTQPTELDEALVRIRAVFDALAEGAAERDQANEHPYALVSDLAGAGFGRLRLPREFGGFGVDLPTLFALLAEAGQADSNLPQICAGTSPPPRSCSGNVIRTLVDTGRRK